jgi:MOSC domain-containing protein YiiM
MNPSPFYGSVLAVCLKSEPGLPKYEVEAIQLIEDLGVLGDYHAGKLIRHRYLADKDPTRPNNRQVLLVDTSIHADVLAQGIKLKPGMLGENVLLDGIKVMSLPLGTRLTVGEALLELNEVRNPCYQLDDLQPHLLKAVSQEVDGVVQRNAGMLARIIRGGWVRPGDSVIV